MPDNTNSIAYATHPASPSDTEAESQARAIQKFSFGANSKIVGKCKPESLSYAGAFRRAEGTFSDLAAHISKGYPWMPALLDEGSRRYQDRANFAEIVAADVDHGMTMDEALQQPFIAAHCGLAIESSSSTPEQHKFRLVFRLPAAVTDWQTIRICNRYLIERLASADPSCKDACRFFFGGKGRRAFLLNEEAALPADFIEQAIAWHNEEERVKEAAYQLTLSRRQEYETGGDDLLERVKEALNYIPRRSLGSGNYEESLRVLMALTNEFGEATATALGEYWSPSIPGTSWDVASKVASLKRGNGRPVTIASLFKLAIQNGYKPPQSKAGGFDWLKRAMKIQPQAATVKRQAEQPQAEVKLFDSGDRLATWKDAVSGGYRYILDSTPPGSGKTYDAGLVVPEEFGADGVTYLSGQHRNPTVDTLKGSNEWVDLEGRHAGLVREDTPGGGSRLRRIKAGDKAPTIPSNCARTGVIGALREKAVEGADTSKLICGTCPLKEQCGHISGYNFGFLNERRSSLSAVKMRSHPDSQPSPDEFDYSSQLNIWDEPGENFKTKLDIAVSLHDVEQTIAVLLKVGELAPAQELLATILGWVDGSVKTGRYGLGQAELVKLLPDISGIDVEAVQLAIAPDLSFLNTTSEYGVDLADLSPKLRSQFADKGWEATQKAGEQVVKQWLPHLLRIISGDRGYLSLRGGVLVLSLPAERHGAVALASKANIFLDATLSRTDLALKLGCGVDEILEVRGRVPENTNLEIIQVMDVGRLGQDRGQAQMARVAGITASYRAADPEGAGVIDFKKFAEDGDGAWWRDSRGTNDYQAARTLILVGTPCANIADQQAEFAILTGSIDFEGDAFTSFVDRATKATIIQGIGRIRADRRPDEKLTVVLLSNFELGIPTAEVTGYSICPEGGTKVEQLVGKAKAAIAHMKALGQKITQDAIAALCGCSQGRISQLGDFINSAINNPNSKINNSEAPPLTPELVGYVEAIAAEGNPEQILNSIAEIFFDWTDPTLWLQMWRSLTNGAQNNLMGALILTLPDEQLAELQGE